jgi:peptide deformylase
MKDVMSYKGVVYALVKDTDPILSEEMPRFDFDNPAIDPIQLAYDLVESMRHHNGIGLSANQIGLPYRAFAMEAVPAIVCFNPKLIDESSEEILLEEGCLSFPGLGIKIKRPRHIKVRYAEPSGEVITKKFTGMAARCFLHELDHMNGTKYIDRASFVQKELAFKRQKKLAKLKRILK